MIYWLLIDSPFQKKKNQIFLKSLYEWMDVWDSDQRKYVGMRQRTPQIKPHRYRGDKN